MLPKSRILKYETEDVSNDEAINPMVHLSNKAPSPVRMDANIKVPSSVRASMNREITPGQPEGGEDETFKKLWKAINDNNHEIGKMKHLDTGMRENPFDNVQHRGNYGQTGLYGMGASGQGDNKDFWGTRSLHSSMINYTYSPPKKQQDDFSEWDQYLAPKTPPIEKAKKKKLKRKKIPKSNH